MYSILESEYSCNYDDKIPPGVNKGRILNILICYAALVQMSNYLGSQDCLMVTMRLAASALMIALALTSSACSMLYRQGDPCFSTIDTSAKASPFVLEGYYIAEFEVSSFVPCGCDVDPGYGRGYWLSGDPQSGFTKVYQRSSPTSDYRTPGIVVYVRFEGMVSDYGTHGHLGMYLREITVTKLIEVDTNGECHFNE